MFARFPKCLQGVARFLLGVCEVFARFLLGVCQGFARLLRGVCDVFAKCLVGVWFPMVLLGFC